VSSIKLTVNGKPISAEVEDRTLLVHLLRDQLGLTGTHIGCDTSQYGTCTVHIDGRSCQRTFSASFGISQTCQILIAANGIPPIFEQNKNRWRGPGPRNFCRCQTRFGLDDCASAPFAVAHNIKAKQASKSDVRLGSAANDTPRARNSKWCPIRSMRRGDLFPLCRWSREAVFGSLALRTWCGPKLFQG
jgi:hypothetical protein